MTEEFFEKILTDAIEKKATDIHLCAGSAPLLRVKGTLVKLNNGEIIPFQMLNDIVEMLVPLRKMEILENKRSLDFSVSRRGIGRFRCTVYYQRNSFAIALRVLPFEIPRSENLGLSEIVEKVKTKNKGLFLVTGATGSGKSTTLASIIDMLNETRSCHIVTIEDPIEYLHKHKEAFITQKEIGSDALTFADALRSALREDPDVIMVGEMRDPETIAIALTAAETGHLVLSTLHTVGAAKSIDRIIDSFEPKQQAQIKNQLATALEGVMSQELIPRADGEGVCLATEVMFTTAAIKNLIREGKQYQINSILQTGQATGMHMMEESIADLLKQGLISAEEAEYRAHDPNLLKQFMNRR